MDLKQLLTVILQITLPYIKQLIESEIIPFLKRKAYERVDKKVDNLIKDLAQNASKIKDETDEAKKFAYIEGTKLGIETLRAIAEKLDTAADEIEKVL
jgi:hypothetical protein